MIRRSRRPGRISGTALAEHTRLPARILPTSRGRPTTTHHREWWVIKAPTLALPGRAEAGCAASPARLAREVVFAGCCALFQRRSRSHAFAACESTIWHLRLLSGDSLKLLLTGHALLAFEVLQRLHCSKTSARRQHMRFIMFGTNRQRGNLIGARQRNLAMGGALVCTEVQPRRNRCE